MKTQPRDNEKRVRFGLTLLVGNVGTSFGEIVWV